jgi:hypothetical protein
MNNTQLSVLGRQTSATTILVIDEQLLVSSAGRTRCATWDSTRTPSALTCTR